MSHIHDIKASENSESNPLIKIMTLEKAYFSYQNVSLISLLKHMKHFLLEQNRQAKETFQDTLRKYNGARRDTEKTYKGVDDDLKLAFEINQQFPGSFEEFLENQPSENNNFATDLTCDLQDIIAERILDKERSSGAVVELNITGSTQPIHYPLDKYVDILTESPTKDRKEKKLVKYCLNVKEGYDLSAVE